MKKYLFSLIVLCSFWSTYAQVQPEYLSFDWGSAQKFDQIKTTDDPILGLLEKHQVEFIFDGENLAEFALQHRAVWLNSDESIEDFNRIYLPYSASSELVVSRARVIQPGGKAQELDQSKILTAQDEETGQQYKYFAFEGIEKGSIVEYYYVERKQPSYNGRKYRLQSKYRVEDLSFELLSPSNLGFAFKTYALPEIQEDSVPGKNRYRLSVKGMKGLENEQSAPYNASRASLVYKIDENKARNRRNLVSYKTASQNIFKYYNEEPSKKAAKLLQDFFTELGITATADEEAKIRMLENGIKRGIYEAEVDGDAQKDLEQILINKVASSTGVIKLYVAALDALGIENQIVFTTDRGETVFDKDFEAYNFLQEVLLYFPKYKKYLAPNESNSRYGFPPGEYTDNYGLFIKQVKVGSYVSAVGKVQYIAPVRADKSIDRMKIDVNFDADDLSQNTVKLGLEMTGYYAVYLQPFFDLVKGKERDDLIESFGKRVDANADIKVLEVKGGNPADFGVKPLEFIMELQSQSLTEKAGRKFLFKLGQLIGPQIEMYQEKARVLPLENDFTRTYYRTITLQIPEGYRVVNPEDINIDHHYIKDGQELMYFRSSYEQKGNQLIIKADESYDINKIPVEIFEQYRTVINSAADFNKVTLVLEPVQ